MMPWRALPADGARARTESAKRRPACRLRRHFFAAAALLAAACLAAAPADPPLPRPAPADIRSARAAAASRDGGRLLVIDGIIAFTDGLDVRRLAATPAATARVGSREAYIVLLLAVANARQRVWLCSGHLVPDERLLQALAQAAGRGVDVRLVLPGSAAAWAPFHAGRARYGELLGAGVRIFERRAAPRHAGAAGAAAIWASQRTPALPGQRADLIVIDRGFARQLEQRFRLSQAAAHELSLAEWQRRGPLCRLKEWLARAWQRL